MRLILLLTILLWSVDSFALSPKLPKFTYTYSGSSTNTTDWVHIEYVTYIDYTLVSTAGGGVMTVQYAVDSSGTAAHDDGNTNAWTASDVDSLVGSGIGKQYARLSVTCTSAPCTYTVYFNGKGLK